MASRVSTGKQEIASKEGTRVELLNTAFVDVYLFEKVLLPVTFLLGMLREQSI